MRGGWARLVVAHMAGYCYSPNRSKSRAGRERIGVVGIEIGVDIERTKTVLIEMPLYLVVYIRYILRVRSSYLRVEVVVAIGDGSAQEDTMCEIWVPYDARHRYMNSSKVDGYIYRTAGRGNI